MAWFIFGVFWLALALLTGRVAKDKGLSDFGGILLSLIIGPLALAIILLMPRRAAH